MSKEEKAPRKIKIVRFATDNNLMYLIQGVTKKPTQDILGYFHNMALVLTEESLKHTVASYLKRRLDFFYPDTPIPYRIEVTSGNLRYNLEKPLEVHVSISFPKKTTFTDMTDLMAQFTEIGLGLVDGEDLPKFEQPATRIPRGMKNKL